jgi:hypothetical protein
VDALPATYATSRRALQRVAVHVLARRRNDLSGRFGLRVAPDGIATPAAGPELEVLRTSGSRLVREVGGASASTTSIDLATATLGEAAAFAGVDLGAPFDVGHDTPPVGDPDAPLAVDDGAARQLGRWLAFAWPILDDVVGDLGPAGTPSILQLWPEHFDAGCDVAVGSQRTNLGASTGDEGIEQPYLYVGPWAAAHDDDPFWNASFGAVLTFEELRASSDPVSAAAAFLRRGLELLG